MIHYLLKTTPVLVRAKHDICRWGWKPYDINRVKFMIKEGDRFWAAKVDIEITSNKEKIKETKILIFKKNAIFTFSIQYAPKDVFEFIDNIDSFVWKLRMNEFNHECTYAKILIPVR